MKIRPLPKIGLRNVKTALSVLTCILFFEIIRWGESPFYACIASVICMGDSVENSMKAGKNRLIGTLVGGLYGIFFIFIYPFVPIPLPLLVSLGIVIVIYTGVLIKKPASVSISCVVFLAITTNLKGITSYGYAVNRIVETAVGIIIAIFVNKYVNFPSRDDSLSD
ncbi:aromatic acid exporter family protein [Clostridium sp. YIM B02551]|uniref:FUSC family protein n=1 Tax=Clostridium sp. YIM B02551 TaxID=2910679 RepID=UPI001EEBCA1F|nr:aromatic acid exporter family protein [Clostridium sp. YIM B02551]